jgi:hypothetical protein
MHMTVNERDQLAVLHLYGGRDEIDGCHVNTNSTEIERRRRTSKLQAEQGATESYDWTA